MVVVSNKGVSGSRVGKLNDEQQSAALQSWEQALTNGLHKMKKTGSGSKASGPPKSLLNPKINTDSNLDAIGAKKKRGNHELPGIDMRSSVSSVGPSASVMAFLAEK